MNYENWFVHVIWTWITIDKAYNNTVRHIIGPHIYCVGKLKFTKKNNLFLQLDIIIKVK